MRSGPFKKQINEDTTGVVMRILTTYKLVRGVMVREVATRRYTSLGSYHDTTEVTPLGAMFPSDVEYMQDKKLDKAD
ncbi:MAG: hypothetical protein CMD98_06860 [Gammaproteobacteria bacterium]|nr:hypothetical protein [Gammaproteobacteria bacterium]|tara:strand:+ start:42896 stop:43126 length:231 start_codon:yes stop_codon:yes gene_type:complete